MRLLHFFRLLNKKTNGLFAITSITLIIFGVNIIIALYGYGILHNHEGEPLFEFLLLSTALHGFTIGAIWVVWYFIYHRFRPFIRVTIIPLWKEDGKQTKQFGGKVKF